MLPTLLPTPQITLGSTPLPFGLATTSVAGLTLSGATLVTPTLGVAAGTSLALGGATIGTNALAVTGTSAFGGAVTVTGASFGLSGNISAPAWTTNGIRYKNVAATLTDTTSSGTVAAAYNDLWGGSTVAALSATTYTNYYGSYFNAPVAGTNVTMTNKYALGADSIFGGSFTAPIIGGVRVFATQTSGGPANIGGIYASSIAVRSGVIIGPAVLDSTNGWDSSLAFSNPGTSTPDVVILRDAAGILAQRNGVNAQIFRVGATWTNASNYAWAMIDAGVTASDTLTFGSKHLGTTTPLTKFNLLVDGTSKLDYGVTTGGVWSSAVTFQVTNSGGAINAPSNGFLGFSASSLFSAPSNGVVRVSNNSATDFSRLQLGGTTASFPAIKRNATGIDIRLADDSAYAPIAASAYSVGATAGVSGGPYTTISSITVTNGIITAITGS